MKPKPQVMTHIVPKGAAVMGAFLVGMTAIGVTSYAMRNPAPTVPETLSSTPSPVPAPVVLANIATDLPSPSGFETANINIRSGTIAGDGAVTPDTPRLAALTPAHTTLAPDLVSPLSRVFLGTPPLTPPDRPDAGGETVQEAALRTAPELSDTEAGTDLAEEDLAPELPSGLLASLRPQLRPTTLQTASSNTQEPVRVASLSRPEITRGAVEFRRAPATVPQTPRIVAPSARCPKQLVRDMPRRSKSAPGASIFLTAVQSVDGVKRDQQVVSEILKGNMPRFQKNLVPVTLSGKTSDGKTANVTLCVTPDYLALGSDSDFVRVPLGLNGASQVARSFNMLLPTPRMVDAIYQQADLRLSPSPMTPGPKMTSTAYFERHNATVESQRQNAGAAHGTLISGHKKDVVSTSRLASNRGRVAIYGWHRRNGQPIQPLSTVHGAGYADYSHGIRLVSRTAYLDGREVDLRNLIADPRYAGVISHEGPLSRAALASN